MSSGITLRIVLWLLAGTSGAFVFWFVQWVTGGPTIPEFMGQQIVTAGGYPSALAPVVGWAVHLGVSLSYAFLFALIAFVSRPMGVARRAAVTFIVAVGLGYFTTLIAPPAISVTISVLSGQGWPPELFPLNAEPGLPFWNHQGFFALNWGIQVVGPGLLHRPSLRRAPSVLMKALQGAANHAWHVPCSEYDRFAFATTRVNERRPARRGAGTDAAKEIDDDATARNSVLSPRGCGDRRRLFGGGTTAGGSRWYAGSEGAPNGVHGSRPVGAEGPGQAGDA